MKVLKQSIMSLSFLFALSMMGIAFMPATASAQTTSTFMYVDGINGGSTDAKHQGWINVTSFVQSMQVVKAGPAQVQQPVCGGMEIVKGLDNAGPGLWNAAMNLRMLGDVRIEVMVRDVKVYEIRLSNARVTSIMSAGAFAFAETVTLTAQSVKLTSFPQTASGAPGQPASTSFLCN
jgi:type VI protein secretion system component Hcp